VRASESISALAFRLASSHSGPCCLLFLPAKNRQYVNDLIAPTNELRKKHALVLYASLGKNTWSLHGYCGDHTEKNSHTIKRCRRATDVKAILRRFDDDPQGPRHSGQYLRGTHVRPNVKSTGNRDDTLPLIQVAGPGTGRQPNTAQMEPFNLNTRER
jgi:hypothetical protein